MQALNIQLFQWLVAKSDPHPLGLWLAMQGAWLCVIVMCIVIWRYPKERRFAIGVAVAAGLASLIAHYLADAIAMPRPFMVGLTTSHIPHGARGSLPSAHASVMFTVALMLLRRPSLRIAGLTAFVLAAATGGARVYAGVHFPLDIVAGLALAVVLSGAVLGLDEWRRRVMERRAPAALAIEPHLQ